MDGIQSTRQVLPVFHFRRPIQPIPLDDLLTITADNLLESLISTLKDHAKRFQLHIEQQKEVYSNYIKTVSEIQVVKSSTKAIKKSCAYNSNSNSKPCKSPAVFEIKTCQLEINKDVEKKALEFKKEAYTYFYTTVDSRISTQILMAIGKIKSIISHFEDSSDIKTRDNLLQLAWSCIEFLWQELKTITTYPPVKTFLNQICELLKNMISNNSYSMDRLIQLFDNDLESIEYLYLLFNPNNCNAFIQRYRQITQIILNSKNISTAQIYLVQSFDIVTWAKTDNARNESNRQELYLIACDYIEQSFINNNISSDNNNTSRNLSMIYASQIVELMQSYLLDQEQINQGEILYVLHILLNMIATVINSTSSKEENNFQNDLNNILDSFTNSLTTHPLQDIFSLWQSPSLSKLDLALVNDADHILDALYTILTQQCSFFHHKNILDLYKTVCMSISRLILTLMLDSANLTFDLTVKMFSLFWQSIHRQDTLNTNNNPSERVTNDYEDDDDDSTAIQYFIRSFELVLKQLINLDDGVNEKEILIKIFKFYHHDIFYRHDTKLQDYFYKMMHTVHWHSLQLSANGDNDLLDILWKSTLYLISNNKIEHKRNVGQYLKFVYIFLQQTILIQINNNNISKNNKKELQDFMNHHQLIIYIKLAFIILMNVDLVWPKNKDRLQKVEILWFPIHSTINNIQLSPNDIHDIVLTTQICSASNWNATLDDNINDFFDDSSKGNSHSKISYDNTGNDHLSVCIRWMQTLTIKDTANDFDKIKVFGSFILPLLSNINDEKTLQQWLKFLLGQAEMTMGDGSELQMVQLQDYIDWFQILINTLLSCGNERYNDKLNAATFNTIYQFISSCQSNIAFVIYATSIPPISIDQTPTKSTIKIINNKLLLMEHCIERYMHFEKDHKKVWVRIGSVMYDNWKYDMQKNTTAKDNDDDKLLTNYINYCIQHCMELSCFLVIRAYCQGKLQQLYTNNQYENGDIGVDHHISEEVAAIISLTHLQPEKMANIKQVQRFIELLQLYTSLFSKYKNQQQVLNLWMASLVSLSKTFTRWNTIESFDFYHHGLSSLKDQKDQKDSVKNGNNNLFWNLLTKLLDTYLTRRLIEMGVPSFKEDDNNYRSWMEELNNLKTDKNYKQFEKLISFGVEAIQDKEQWTLWDLYKFIENIMDLI
ncbi:hypothetical protein BJ944DRAFT_260945 [Cunninghamella echinulata]|nr:hypothetical protein BJ944DRAFT_260945 [Cunninghamella echinulata]